MSRRSGSRIALLLGAWAISILVIGWSIFWLVASWRAQSEFANWIAQEKLAGQIWTCPDQTSGGYPFRIIIGCTAPSFSGTVAGERMEAAVGAIRAESWLHALKLATVELRAPLTLRLPNSAMRAETTWAAMRVTLRGMPDQLDRVSIVGSAADLSVTKAGTAPQRTRIAALETHMRRAPGTGNRAINLAMSFAGVTNAALDAATGTATPAIVALIGQATQADALASGTVSERLDRWRLTGGRLQLIPVSITKGDLYVEASGNVGLDQRHRLDGKVDVTGRGVDSILRMVIGAPLVGLLGTLARGDNPGDIKLPLVIDGGGISAGPLRNIVTLPPLY